MDSFGEGHSSFIRVPPGTAASIDGNEVLSPPPDGHLHPPVKASSPSKLNKIFSSTYMCDDLKAGGEYNY